MKIISSAPAAIASCTAYCTSGLSTTGSISLALALVAGRNRVPSPATGNTALRIRIESSLVVMSNGRHGSSWHTFGAGVGFQRWHVAELLREALLHSLSEVVRDVLPQQSLPTFDGYLPAPLDQRHQAAEPERLRLIRRQLQGLFIQRPRTVVQRAVLAEITRPALGNEIGRIRRFPTFVELTQVGRGCG